MKIYLAAAFTRQPEMQGVRDVLTAFGHEVTARWLDEAGAGDAGLSAGNLTDPATGAPFAKVDLEDLTVADTMISFTYDQDSSRGGRHVEFGYALGIRKRVILVGPRQHVFHCLPEVEHYPSWPRLVMALSEPTDSLAKGTPDGS